MKIVVTAAGPSLESDVDARFGRCPYFVFVEIEEMGVDAVENLNASLGGGAGIQAAQTVVDYGAQAVLTGNCGPNAYQVLAAAGVVVYTGAAGTVGEAVEAFKRGEFGAARRANVTSHHGMREKP